MELKARGSENRHIPERRSDWSNEHDMASRTIHTDDDELPHGKGGIFWIWRHVCGIRIRRGRLRLKRLACSNGDGNQGFTGQRQEDPWAGLS